MMTDKNERPEIAELDELSNRVIGCIIEVHRILGPGLLESIYHKALLQEFELNGIACESEKEIPVNYKDKEVGSFRADIIVEKSIVLELKSVASIDPLYHAQLLSYLKLGGYCLGFLVNFNTTLVKKGIKRFVN